MALACQAGFYKHVIVKFIVKNYRSIDSRKSDIEQLDGIEHYTMPPISDYKWFKLNWARKDNDPWKLNISTYNISTIQEAKINCPNVSHVCNQ